MFNFNSGIQAMKTYKTELLKSISIIILFLSFMGSKILAEEFITKLPLWGGEIDHISLCLSSPAVIYAGNETSLWVSKDYGETWKETRFKNIAMGGAKSFVVHPTTPNVIVAIGGPANRVYRSTDYGETWTEIILSDIDSRYFAAWQVVFSPENHDTFYIIANITIGSPGGAVYKSTDGGITWTKTGFSSNGKPVNNICINKDGKVFVSVLEGPMKTYPKPIEASAGYLYRSVDGGNNWTNITSNIGPRICPVGKISASFSGLDTICVSLAETRYPPTSGFRGIWVSTDGGNSFSRITLPDNRNLSISWRSGLIVSTAGCTVYCYDLGTDIIHKSSYTAGSWSHFVPISTNKMVGGGVSTILIDPINPNNMYTNDLYEYAFYKSTDAGVTWRISNTGLAGLVVYDGCKSNQGHLYVISIANVYKSTDAGSSWNRILGEGSFTGVITTNPDPEKDYVYVNSRTGLWLSKNGGQTWTKVLATDPYRPEVTPTHTPAKTIVFNPKNPNIGYVAYREYGSTGETKRRYIYKTSDYGETWSQIPLESMSVQALAIDLLDPTIIYAGLGEVSIPRDESVAFGGLWKIVDRGGNISWSKIGFDNKIPYRIVIDTTNPNIIYVACIEDPTKTMGPLYVSRDRGATWSRVGTGDIIYGERPTDKIIDMKYSYPALYFASFDGIYATLNGITYEKIVDSKDIGMIRCLVLGSLYAGTSTGLWKLNRPPQLLTYTVEKPKVYVFPNPFNANRGYTVLKYFVPQRQTVTSLRISIYNIAGELVYEYNEDTLPLQGGLAYYYSWDGRNQDGNMCARGVYIVVFKSNLGIAGTKVVLTRF